MATQVQFRRGTTTENNAFTGAIAELTVDTTLTTLRVHDGTTAGGISIINANSSQVITNKTYGNGNTWEGTPPTLTYGGTGKALTAVQGGIVYSDSDSMEISLAGTAGQVLTSGGTAAPIWVTPSSLTVGTASVATTASNIAGGSAGYIVYQFDTDDTSFIEPGATGTFLRSTGASTAPNWATASVIFGSTEVDLGSTSTSLEGLTLIDATTGATSFFDTPTGSVELFYNAQTITIGADNTDNQVVFSSTNSIQIPVGTTAQRDGTPVAGQIRYNSTISSFEGYGPGNAWGSLGGVKDVDQDTYLLTEVSAGSDEDTFEFYNAGTNTASLDETNFALKNDVCFKVDSTVTAHPSHSAGQIFFCPDQKAVSFHNDISGISLQIGHEEWVRIYNGTGSTITNGTPVYATGQNGGIISVAPADATTEAKSQVIGVMTHDVAASSQGVATVKGLVQDIDTSALTAGDRVHVGSSGALQTAAPTYPYFPTDVGTCVVSDASTGKLYVSIQEHTMEQFRVTGNTHMDGDLTVNGDFTVNGTQTITSQANLALDNAFIYMNSGDTIGEANTTFDGTGLDDAYFTGHYNGTTSTTYYVRIDGVGTGTGGVDTFEWSKDDFSTTEATGVDIAATVVLDNGISIDFNATTGHTDNDEWSGTAAPLNTDTGWASNRNTGGSGVGYTHIGVVWDTASSQMIMFDEYSPEVDGNIDTGHASFSYAPLQIAGLTATTGAFSSNATVGGTLTVTGATTMNSNLDLNGDLDVSGNITSSSGAISFGNENLSTTGTLSAGAITGSSLNLSTGAVTAGSLDISGNADIDGTMEADAYTVNGTALNEYIADTVGAMVSSNTETGLSVTYDDADNTLDFSLTADPVITISGDASGSATMTNLTSANISISLATDSVAANEISANAVGASELNVSGNGTSGQALTSDGDGTMSWTTITKGSLGLDTSNDVQFDSLGIGTAASGTTGEIRATNQVTAYYSDARLKDFEGTIDNALDKVMALNGYYYKANKRANEIGYITEERQVGVSAQEVEAVMPEIIAPAPINDVIPREQERDYKTVHYEKLVPLLIEAMKEQQKQIDELKKKLGE